MTTATQSPIVERYRKMVDIIDNCRPDEAYIILADHMRDAFTPYYELVVSKEAEYSYRYAKDVIKGRWEPGEEAVSKDAESSYRYARDVVRDRWEPCEEAISKDAHWSYHYAKDVIKGRWEPGEEAISKDKETLANYAFNVIKGRLPEHLERVLLSDEDSL